jgi:hypothetical protein
MDATLRADIRNPGAEYLLDSQSISVAKKEADRIERTARFAPSTAALSKRIQRQIAMKSPSAEQPGPPAIDAQGACVRKPRWRYASGFIHQRSNP